MFLGELGFIAEVKNHCELSQVVAVWLTSTIKYVPKFNLSCNDHSNVGFYRRKLNIILIIRYLCLDYFSFQRKD